MEPPHVVFHAVDGEVTRLHSLKYPARPRLVPVLVLANNFGMRRNAAVRDSCLPTKQGHPATPMSTGRGRTR